MEEVKEAQMTDLMSGSEYTMPFNDHDPVRLSLGAWKAAILKIR